MKLQHIQEARYHGVPKIITQIEQAIKDAETDSGEFPATIDVDDIDQAIKDITTRYGSLSEKDSGDEYVTWLAVGRVPRLPSRSEYETGKDIYRIDITLDVEHEVIEVY